MHTNITPWYIFDVGTFLPIEMHDYPNNCCQWLIHTLIVMQTAQLYVSLYYLYTDITVLN